MTLYKVHCDYCLGYEYDNGDGGMLSASAYGLSLNCKSIGGSDFTVCPRCIKKVFDVMLSPRAVFIPDLAKVRAETAARIKDLVEKSDD